MPDVPQGFPHEAEIDGDRCVKKKVEAVLRLEFEPPKQREWFIARNVAKEAPIETEVDGHVKILVSYGVTGVVSISGCITEFHEIAVDDKDDPCI